MPSTVPGAGIEAIYAPNASEQTREGVCRDALAGLKSLSRRCM